MVLGMETKPRLGEVHEENEAVYRWAWRDLQEITLITISKAASG